MKGVSLSSALCTALALHLTILSTAVAQPGAKVLNYPKPVEGAQFSPDGKWLAVVTGGSLIVLDAKSYKPATVVPVSNYNGVSYLTFSPDGKKIAAATGPHAQGLGCLVAV